MKEKVLSVFKKGETLTEEEVLSRITGKPIFRVWEEEDHKIYVKMFSALCSLKKEGYLKSYNNGFNDFAFKKI